MRVDDVTSEEALTMLAEMVALRHPHHIMTPNPEYVMIARSDRDVRDLMESVDLALADGVGLKWAGAMLAQTIREVVPGSEIVVKMANYAARREERWFLLGAAEGVAEEAGKRLAEGNPGLTIAGTFAGAPQTDMDDEICRRIEAVAPVDVLLVAYGAPAQDLWIARNQPRLRVPVAIGVGGTFNFIAGVSRTPPELVKRLGLIWMFRLITEPWRWKRQLALIRFVSLVLRSALTGQ